MEIAPCHFLPPNTCSPTVSLLTNSCTPTGLTTQELVLGHLSTFALLTHASINICWPASALTFRSLGNSQLSVSPGRISTFQHTRPLPSRPDTPAPDPLTRPAPTASRRWRLSASVPAGSPSRAPAPSVTAPFPLFTCQQVPNFLRDRTVRGGAAGVGHGCGWDLDSRSLSGWAPRGCEPGHSYEAETHNKEVTGSPASSRWTPGPAPAGRTGRDHGRGGGEKGLGARLRLRSPCFLNVQRKRLRAGHAHITSGQATPTQGGELEAKPQREGSGLEPCHLTGPWRASAPFLVLVPLPHLSLSAGFRKITSPQCLHASLVRGHLISCRSHQGLNPSSGNPPGSFHAHPATSMAFFVWMKVTKSHFPPVLPERPTSKTAERSDWPWHYSSTYSWWEWFPLLSGKKF